MQQRYPSTIILTCFMLLGLSSLNIKAKASVLSRVEYISAWKDEAIYQMVLHKIPASITLAQGILESGDGNSELAIKANNHFGIKCHSDWAGKRTYHDDDRKGECFRKYDDARQSYEDHSMFLQASRYQSLFELKMTDYKGWAKGLKSCGYATNSKYSALLIRLIEENDLTQYDKIAIQLIKDGEAEALIALREKNKSSQKESRKKENKKQEEKAEIILKHGNEILISDNRVKYIITKKDYDFQSLALELDMMPWQLWKYNELKKKDNIDKGQIIYLQPKRNKAAEASHIVREGESLYEISQVYGVKTASLRKRNHLVDGQKLVPGQRLELK